MGRLLCCPNRLFYCAIRAFEFDQLDVIYAGPDRSFYYAIRSFEFDQLDVIYARSDKSFYCAIRTFNVDQLDVIYAGLDKSCYYAIRTFESTLYNEMIYEDMRVGKNKDILLLIIPFQVHGIPHSWYRGSICFIYGVGTGFTSPHHDIRSFLVGLEFPCSGVCSILENFPQDQVARLKHSRLYPFVINVCQAAMVGRYADCRSFPRLILRLIPWQLILHFLTRAYLFGWWVDQPRMEKWLPSRR